MNQPKKYLLLRDPSHFLQNKYNTDDDMIFIESSSSFPSTIDYSALGKKYFGRKITFINQLSDLPRALNQSKLFSNLEFLSDLSLQLEKLKSKGTTKIISSLESNQLTPSQLKRLVTSCTGKISFTRKSSEKLVFQLAKFSMRNIKELRFDWDYSSELQFDSWALRSLRSLEKLKIVAESVIQYEEENINHRISNDYEAANIIRFAENIARLPRLNTVYLNFVDLETPIDLLLNFVLTIANSKIENWYVDMVLPMSNVENIALLEPVLAKINGLGIYTGGSFCELKKVEKIIQNKKGVYKMLGIFIQDAQELLDSEFQVNIYSFLKHCKFLQTLAIGSNGFQFIYQEQDFNFQTKENRFLNKDKRSPESPEWARHLQSLMLFSPPEIAPFFGCNFQLDILEKIQKESKNLKTVSVFSSRPCVITDRKKPWSISSEIYPLVCDQLTGIKSLEKAQVSLQTIHFSHLDKFLSSAPNLRILNLKLNHCRSSHYWDDELPFAKLKNLKEIKITFNGFLQNGFWGDNLVHQIAELNSLEVFSIKTKKSWRMLLSKLCILLKNAAALPRLKSLVLKTQIVKSPEMDEGEPSMFKTMVEGLRQVIKFMVSVQEKIEYIHLMKFDNCGINSIKHKK